MADLGRQVKYGIGKEATAGTGVAPTNWVNQLKFELNPMSEYKNNESAWGNLVKTNSSTVLHQHAEGSLEAKLTDKTSGLILLGAFGSVSSAATADSGGTDTVYAHTFTLNEDVSGQTLTLVRKDSLSTMAYSRARVGKWELDVKLDDYITFTADMLTAKGTSTTATPAYVEESEFVAKHVTVKSASTSTGLSGATALSSVQSFKLTSNPNTEIDWEFGNAGPADITSRGYELSFEMTARYNDQAFENAYNDGTELAFELAIKNTDVTIGESSNPGLVVTAYKVNITDWARSEDLDGPIDQTFTGTIHFSATDVKALQAILTNTQTSY